MRHLRRCALQDVRDPALLGEPPSGRVGVANSGRAEEKQLTRAEPAAASCSASPAAGDARLGRHARLALVPHPREHQWTYFGVLAPASPLRDAVVPRSPERRQPAEGDDPCARASRRSWAELLERTFAVDVLRCPKCGGRRHRIATITDPIVARKILLHLGLRAEPPELAPVRPEPQRRFA